MKCRLRLIELEKENQRLKALLDTYMLYSHQMRKKIKDEYKGK